MRQVSNNRLLGEMEQWKAREQRFAKLFSPSILQSRAFQKEKLRYYERLQNKYRKAENPDELLTRKLLGQERRHLEKRLYPNRVLRNSRNMLRAAGALIDASIRMMSKIALPLNATRGHENPGFQETITWQAAGKNLDAGMMLKNEQQNLNANEAANLRSGRAVLKDNEWLMLDKNDKDADGNYRMKSIPAKHAPDVEKELSKLPLKELEWEVTKDSLLKGLKNGNRMEVSVMKGGRPQKHFIEMHPVKGLQLWDKNGMKMGKEDISGKKESVGLSKGKVVQMPPEGSAKGMKISR